MVRNCIGINRLGHHCGRVSSWSEGDKGNSSHPPHSERVSSSQIPSRPSRVGGRRPNRGYGSTHDFHNDGEVRRVTDLRPISTTPPVPDWRTHSNNPCRDRHRRWWWCVGGIVELAAAPEGQFLLQLCSELGLTLSELSDMDPREVQFYVNALNERNRSDAQSMSRAQTRARHRQMRGGR